MKLLYCHDNFYLRDDDHTVFSAGQFPYSYWKPYLDNFGTLMVTGRAFEPSVDNKRHNVSGGPNVSFSLFPNINTPLGALRYRKDVSDYLKMLVSNSDAVVIRAVSDIGWLAYKHARKMNKPIAMEMAACAWDSTWNHGSPFAKIYAPVRYIRDRIMTKNVDFTIYVTKEFLQKRYPTDGQTTYASNVRLKYIDEDFMDIRMQRIKHNFDHDRPQIIGLIGNLGNRIKGVRDALDALKIVHAKKPGAFIFRHLGPGDAEPYIKHAKDLGVSDVVKFDGMLETGEKVFEWIKDVDIYIQPSYQEGLPRATIEAMSLGCPVIASTAGGIPELIDEKWLIKPGDHKRLAALLIDMMNSAECQVGAAGRNAIASAEYVGDILRPKRHEFWRAFAYFAQARKDGLDAA